MMIHEAIPVSCTIPESYKEKCIEYLNTFIIQLNININQFSDNLNSNTTNTCNLITVKDVEEHGKKFVYMIDEYIEYLNSIKVQFKEKFDLWLNDCFKVPSSNDHEQLCDNNSLTTKEDEKKDNSIIIVHDSDSDSDVEIVNEARYLKSLNRFRDNSNNGVEDTTKDLNKNKFYLPDKNLENGLEKKEFSNNESKNLENNCNPECQNVNLNDNFVEENNFEETTAQNQSKIDSLVNLNDNLVKENNFEETTAQNQSKIDSLVPKKLNLDYNYSGLHNFEIEKVLSETDRNSIKNDLIDEKLKKKCKVVLEPLSQKECNKKGGTQTDTSSENEKLKRLCDLSALEKSNKRKCHNSSSDSSCSDLSPKKDDIGKVKSKSKKLKKSSENSDTDISSIYKSSDDSDDENYKSVNNDSKSFSLSNDDEEKQKLLESDEDMDSTCFDSFSDDEKVCRKRKTQKNKKVIDDCCSDPGNSDSSSKETAKKNKSDWLNDSLLQFKFLENDSTNNKKKQRRKSIDYDSDSEGEVINKPKRKRRKKVTSRKISSSEDSDENSLTPDNIRILSPSKNRDEIIEKMSESVEIIEVDNDTDPNQLPLSSLGSKKKDGRRNIRKLFDDEEIGEGTRQAGKDEENRLHRVSKRKEQMEILSTTENEEKDSIILDADLEEKKKKLIVDKGFIKYLKPHQIEGVKFMWYACFESLDCAQKTNGSGCILAHCMGLGKTFQIITLVHTILSNSQVGVQTVMVICPLNTIFNWVDEFDLWLKKAYNKKEIKIHQISQVKSVASRLAHLKSWHEEGGVLIISYEMFRSITGSGKKCTEDEKIKMKKYLLDPGADLVVCDEGHLMKNGQSILAGRMQYIKTKRKIMLTGTPLQNDLKEYHCMVQIVKPNLLGTQKEFLNRFVNPIKNGQFYNSTPEDVKLMKQRSHVLHKMLEGTVQRFDYTELVPFLPPKQEYVVSLRLSKLQDKMYRHYLNNLTIKQSTHFKIDQELRILVAHPLTLQLKAQAKKPSSTKVNLQNTMESDDSQNDIDDDWWLQFNEEFWDLYTSSKLTFLFGLLERCESEDDKILVFSQSIPTLNVIELFLKNFNADLNSTNKDLKTQISSNKINFKEKWIKGEDYFRIDGSVTPEKRNKLCKKFNDPNNKRARLFLVSSRAGGLGINLTGANRVIVIDPNWNPSIDAQSIFRIFRFGQKKPCYIYRLVAAGTIEQKIYNRQVNKLSLSLRVLDEQQVGRHFKDSDLAELYKYESLENDMPAVNVPKDHILADVFLKFKDNVYDIHEHDSLLENKIEEELNDDERKQAWIDYEREKSTKQFADAKTNQKKRSIAEKKEETESPLVNSDESISNIQENAVQNVEPKS